MDLTHITKQELAERVAELEAQLEPSVNVTTSSSGRTEFVTEMNDNGSGSFTLSRDDRAVHTVPWERESGSPR